MRPSRWPRRCEPGSTAWWPAARPSRATRRCTTRWRRPSTPSTRPSATGADLAERAGPARDAAAERPRRDDPDARPQGPRQLSRRAQRRPPGPGRHQRRPAASGRGRRRRLNSPTPHAAPEGDDDDSGTGRRHRGRLSQPGAGARPRWPSPGRCCTGARCASRSPPGSTRRPSAPTPSGSSEAIEKVDGPDGVVVLMDLGSAVLSAELALDLLDDPTARERVVLSSAPIVEGLVVAAVAASGGASRAEVAAEARAALMGKAAHLSGPDDATPGEQVERTGDGRRRPVHRRPTRTVSMPVRPPGSSARSVALDAVVSLRNLTTGPRTGARPAASAASRPSGARRARGRDPGLRSTGPRGGRAPRLRSPPALRRAATTPTPVPALDVSTAGAGPVRRLTGHRDRAGPPADRRAGRRRRHGRGRPRRPSGAGSPRPSPRYAATSSTCAPSPCARSGCRGRDLRRPPDPAGRRRDARRRQASDRHRRRGLRGLERRAWPTSSASGPSSPTPTCASARPTSAPSASRYAACSRAAPRSRPWRRGSWSPAT